MAKKRDIIERGNTKKDTLQLKTNHLLVIGIDRYEDNGIPNLNNAVRDAKRFVEILHTTYQFEAANTIELYNEAATKDKILEVFDLHINDLGKEDNLIVYFSGHGDLLEHINKGYWIPTEARLEKRGDYLSNTEVLDFFRFLKVHHIFAIVDACFSGALAKNLEKPSYNQRVDAKPSRWLLSSGALEKVSDGSGKHSPFANSLFSALVDTDQSEIRVLDLCNEVISTIDSNSKDQTPIGQPIFGVGHMLGQFVFYRKGYAPKIEKEESSASKGDILTRSGAEEKAFESHASEAEVETEELPSVSSAPASTTIDNSKNIITGGTITVGGDLIIGDGNSKEEEAIMDLGPGNLLYDIPDTMELKKPSVCKVRIASNRKILLQDIQTTTSSIIRDLNKITEVMSVELVDISGGINFKILSGSSEEQSVDNEWYTEWTFYVTPLTTGKHTLLLRLSEIKLINNKERKRDITFEEIVEVAAAIGMTKKEPSNLMELKNYIKEEVVLDLIKGIQVYKKYIHPNSSHVNNPIGLESRYNRNHKEEMLGISSKEDINKTYNQIRHALLSFVDELKEEDVQFS